METFQYIILYIGTVICVAHVYDLTYRFQIKEYRLDRFLSFLKEEGFINAVYTRQIRFPSASLRNMLIIALSVLLLIGVIFYAQEGSFIRLMAFVVLAPIASLTVVTVSVLLTEVLAQIRRRKIVREAKAHLSLSKAVVIGITGSYGKTTTKEFLAQILGSRFKVAKTEANMNTDVGIALSILKDVTPETQYFIVEMGAYTKGEIEKACRLVLPKYGILTAIGNQHLSLFGSREKLLAAKKELLEAVPVKGRIYMSKTIEDRSVLVRGIMAPVTLFSSGTKGDITARKVTGKKSSYTVVYKKKSLDIEVPKELPYAIDAILPGVALALDLGMSLKEIQAGVKGIKILPAKLSQSKGIKGSTLLLDTANSSVEGFISAVDALGAIKATGQKYAVSKGVIELGEEKEASYQKILSKLSKNKVSLLTTDRLFKALDVSNNVSLFEEEKKLLAHLLEKINKKTTILLEGRFTPSFIQKLQAQ